MKWMSCVVLVVLALAAVGGVAAQSPSVEWEAWNAQITAHADNPQMDVAETQVINVIDGPLHSGVRDYSQPVEIQNVFFALNGGQPQELIPGNGPGSYQVSNSGGDVVLEYDLPTPAEAGDSFVVQINYSVEEASPGFIDWFVVPGDHAAQVNSSTVTINFPDGQAPDPSFVRMTEGSGSVSVSGNSIIVQSNGVIPANQAFGIQLPFGSNAGVPANPSNPNVAQPAPTGGTGDNSGGLGSLLPLLCIVVVLFLVGGGSLLRNLLGGFGGGPGAFGGTPVNPRSNPFGGFGRGNTPTSGRGFRESPNQNRNLPRINSDKRRGGGASFK
jgi:hypothetical protein